MGAKLVVSSSLLFATPTVLAQLGGGGGLAGGAMPPLQPGQGLGQGGLGGGGSLAQALGQGLGQPPLGQAGGGLGGGLAGGLGGGLGAGLGGGLGGGGLGGGGGGGMASPGIQLPTINLLGGSGGAFGGSASMTPDNIQQLQNEAVQQANLDALCPGMNRQSTNVGPECWMAIWTAGGCKASNAPPYEEWHQAQSLEILVADVVQWANLPDERHQQGCYGDAGPPQNLPPPPMPNMQAPPLGASLGGMTAGGLGGVPMGASQLGGGMAGAAPPSEVEQLFASTLQSALSAGICGGIPREQTSVGETCWKEVWAHAGCLEATTPPYDDWYATQSLEVLIADAVLCAILPDEKHRSTCYGPGRREL
eukprot:CAMPEP_0206524932 /NCGR_PEP_ID=MMETSP0324_2-20121206/68455_1 /ASSEMBLY_ACC=CAM_ASM_000836 /TAXON_ID=2866 /ORGANISM="Crypthecodinium cohnii, Strain Seligo" /LENGTH=363 /DNA_ID=CAMNT_0054019547 /DNA_START=43 /DNA_END=1134 /DNA_ORIENTATION=+